MKLIEYKWPWLYLLIFICGNLQIYGQRVQESDTIDGTHYFSFHNNKWINLHHFLYELTSEEQRKNLKNNGHEIDIFINFDTAHLSKKEWAQLNKGVEFYRENIVGKPLLRSGPMLKWLREQAMHEIISDTGFTKNFTLILNDVNEVYEKHLWPIHKEYNAALTRAYIDLIRSSESHVVKKMESLSGSYWKNKVRVDISRFGNWANAYSPADDHIVVSSVDPQMTSTLFIEFVFHESAHLLFLRSSPFRRTLLKSSKDLKVKHPRNLWHAAMFYLCGLATREALQKLKINHTLIMEAKSVFYDYHNLEGFKETLRLYYDGDIGLEDMTRKLLSL